MGTKTKILILEIRNASGHDWFVRYIWGDRKYNDRSGDGEEPGSEGFC